ncbi:MAG: elongation factor, partial [Acidobacteriota bacterium]|nr:elongation factor [Acidobacteriota bacterium]
MKVYPTNQLRNLACIGHGHAGKTQLIASLLHLTGATQRWGKVDEGTTVTDHDEDAIARKITLNSQLAHCEWREHKINLIDTPGFSAFVPHARPALRVADCALVVVDAVGGVEVGTEKTWGYANEFITPRMMVVNKLDKERADFGAALDGARHTFSRAIVPFTLPIGQEADFRGVVDVVHMKAYEYDAAGKAKEVPIPETGREVVERERERLVEVIAESDDALMEKWLENGTLEESDIIPNISRAIAGSRLCPVFAVSALTLVGLQQLLDGIVDYAPAPDTHEAEHGKASLDDGAAEVTRGYHAEEPFSAYVFRTVADPFAGRINVMKIISGRVKSDAAVQNTTRGAAERLGALHSMQ